MTGDGARRLTADAVGLPDFAVPDAVEGADPPDIFALSSHRRAREAIAFGLSMTDLGFNIGAEISLLTVELGYDIEIASDSITLGPLADFGETLPVADINVFDGTFGLNFTQEQILALA